MSAGQASGRTREEWIAQARRMRAMADQSHASRLAILKRTCRAAGLDVSALHNAMVGQHYGRPWREVDYSLARKAVRQQEQLFEATRILRKWYERTGQEVAS